MALRRTADRVDAQMRDFRRGQNVHETWAASERILVCVGPSPLSIRLVRATKRLAAAVAHKGGSMLDAPVSGGEIGAINATLSIMVGGDAAALARVKPVLGKP